MCPGLDFLCHQRDNVPDRGSRVMPTGAERQPRRDRRRQRRALRSGQAFRELWQANGQAFATTATVAPPP